VREVRYLRPAGADFSPEIFSCQLSLGHALFRELTSMRSQLANSRGGLPCFFSRLLWFWSKYSQVNSLADKGVIERVISCMSKIRWMLAEINEAVSNISEICDVQDRVTRVVMSTIESHVESKRAGVGRIALVRNEKNFRWIGK